jgi:hypothetical protein
MKVINEDIKMNFNSSQINKIMKKAGKKVDEVFRKNEEDELNKKREYIKNLVEIQKKIEVIEFKNPNRGASCCLWNNNVYAVKNNKTVPIHISISDLQISMELIETTKDKKYFLMYENEYKESKRIMDWISEKYAYIKIAINTINKNDSSKNSLTQMLILGGIYESFQKEFPDKNIMYLIEGIKSIDDRFNDC